MAREKQVKEIAHKGNKVKVVRYKGDIAWRIDK